MRKKNREEIVSKNSSKFVDNFSEYCHDNRITERGIQIFPKSEKYRENYDKIFGGRA
jgi:hypothetical protein